MRGVAEANQGKGTFEILGPEPCCEDMACPVRELWQYRDETREHFVARLKAKYSRIHTEAQTS